jgi:beta-carotene/zeaxanthin 4-ketolase
VRQDVDSEQMAGPCRLSRFPSPLPRKFLRSLAGLCLAGLIGLSWLGHLFWLLDRAGDSVSGAMASPVSVGIALGHILFQTFLTTGLFVTVHDAIHGLVCPAQAQLNRALGICFATAYAGLSYEQLSQNHWLHHRAPMTPADPDAQPMDCPGFWPWYFKFLGEYWGLQPFCRLALLLLGFVLLFQAPWLRLGLFWALPLLLSSLQLFFFGTYQPHRRGQWRSVTGGCAPSYGLPWLVSLVTCYHFSYHQEHHDHLTVPWWALPSLYRSLQAVVWVKGQSGCLAISAPSGRIDNGQN